MTSSQDAFRRAVELHGQGHLTEAIALYEDALRLSPNDAAIAANLASALVKAGCYEEGLGRYRQLLESEADRPEIWFNYANALQRSGDSDGARQAFEKTLELGPDFFPAALNLANVVRDQGDLDRACELYQNSIRLNPQHPKPRVNLARLLRGRRMFDEARTVLTEGLQVQPDSDELLYDLALVEHVSGNLDQAYSTAYRILKTQPESGNAFNLLGLIEYERGDTDAAVEWWDRLSRLQPENPEGPINLGTLRQKQGLNDEAVAFFREAVRRAPDDLGANLKLGLFLSTTGHVTEAMTIGQRLMERFPKRSEGFALIANGLHEQGLCTEASEAYAKALESNPDETTLICNALFSSLYSDRMSDEEIVTLHRQLSCRLAEIGGGERISSGVEPGNTQRERLRIGYLSPDLLQHPVGYFIEPVLENHDRSAFEMICYSDRGSADELTARLQQLDLTWHDCSAWNDERLESQIRSDKLDLLVDLAGHTAKNRALVLARKPAPVVATYLGYPGKTERPANDWLIADAKVSPPELQIDSNEKVALLPDCFLCYQPQPEIPEVALAPFEQNNVITFGSFNHLAKMSDSSVRLWSDVLKAVPESRLLLKALPLADAETRRLTQERFAQFGIDPARVEPLPPTVPLSAFLAEYARIDIALDTVPFNGGTTTCDALWMGVPVVTLPGTRFCSRMGLSVLSTVGLTDLIARDEADFVRIAAELAADSERRSQLRGSLRSMVSQSPLCDVQKFTRSLESLYRSIAIETC